jgi:glycosyltransferase involved in cell wall biosynthesis
LITPLTPSDTSNGLQMRAGLLLEGLARSFQVDALVVPVTGGPGEPSELPDSLGARVEVLDLGHPDRSSLPPRCQYATPEICRRVEAHAAGAELVLVHRLFLLPYLDAVFGQEVRPRIIVDVDDIESVIERQLGKEDDARRYESLETSYLQRADGVFTCSEVDRDALLTRLNMRSVEVVPNAIRPPRTMPQMPPDNDLLFVGNLSYVPNVEGILWFCGSVLPQLPETRAAIVGSWPAPEVEVLAQNPQLTVATDVSDVRPWYASSSLAVIPILQGGGSRIKLIEAFAHSRPVVSTTVGAEGLPWPQARSPVLMADTPAAFAAACRSLLNDPERARQLADAGRALVNATATVDVVAARIDESVKAGDRDARRDVNRVSLGTRPVRSGPRS